MFIEIKRSLTTVRKVHHSLIYCSSGRASLARQLLSVWQRVATTVAKPYAPSQTRPSDISLDFMTYVCASIGAKNLPY